MRQSAPRQRLIAAQMIRFPYRRSARNLAFHCIAFPSLTTRLPASNERDEAIKRRAAGEALADIAKSYGVPLRRRRIPQRIAERSEGRAGFAYAFDQLK
jgi:hypothetical protein